MDLCEVMINVKLFWNYILYNKSSIEIKVKLSQARKIYIAEIKKYNAFLHTLSINTVKYKLRYCGVTIFLQ